MSIIRELKRRNVIRVGVAYVALAWLLIQVIETVFPAFGLSDSTFRIVVIIVAIGLIPVLVFAWAFELTPEGLKKEKDVDRSRSITPQTGKKLDRVIMIVLALALAFFAVDKFVLDPRRDAERMDKVAETAVEQAFAEAAAALPERSIAVLPFADLSAEGDQEYFSDGLAEELLNLLAKIPELRVISRHSAFSYKGKNLDIPTIAGQLKVRHILEGSVRRQGDKIRVTAQLIDASNDAHLWSETYDRPLENIFAVQDEISSMVVEKMRVSLLDAAPKSREADPAAYDLYLQGRYLGGQAVFEESQKLLLQALEIDPDYAPAWMALSRNYANMGGRSVIPIEEGYSKAREAADKALALDPECADCFNIMGWIAARWDHDLVTAARHYQNAMRLDSTSPSIVNGVSALLGNLGRNEEALELAEWVVSREPLVSSLRANLGSNFASVGRLEEAIEAYRSALSLNPKYPGANAAISDYLVFLGDPESALAHAEQEPYPVWRLLSQVVVYHALGRSEDSDAALAELIETHSEDAAYNIAYVLAVRNEADRAFAWLDKAVEYQDPGLSEIIGNPHFENIHDDPRWLPFLESIGKSSEQLAEISRGFQLPASWGKHEGAE